MQHRSWCTKLLICLFLFGFWKPVFGLVVNNATDPDELWKRYLANDAWKTPGMQFPYERCFKSAAQRNDLPLSLLLAVARGESNFNPRAKSDRNCHGLMQIQWPQTANHLGIYRLSALYEPCTNIRAGARYLRELLDRFEGNLHLALAAYNYGPNRIQKHTGSGGIPEGARWYSGYIYHHLKRIMQGAADGDPYAVSGRRPVYTPGMRLEIITFNKPYRAVSFYQYIQTRAPELKLDWYRIGLGRFQVVMLYTDENALKDGREKLRRLGIAVKGW